MWVISGPFDGAQEGVKEKLLKPGTTYTVGRAKAGQSLLNRINLEQKSISHEHVEIIVGHYEIDDVSDSQAKPTVQLVLKREKDITVSNQRVGKGMVVDLEAGSEVALTNKISIYMLWKPVVVVNADNRVKKERMREIAAAAAKIGVTVSKTWRDNATHFVTPSINMSRRVLHSLMLGIPLVDLKWLEELFRRGNALTVESEPDENGVVALESHFVLPNEQDFRPKSVKTDEDDEDITGWPIELWDANPARRTIWDGLQFHFFCDDAAPTEWIDQVQLGGGTFKSHNYNPEHSGETVTTIEEAKALFQRIRLGAETMTGVAAMMSPVVIVVKPSELIALLGRSAWMLYQEGMRANGFKHVTPKEITLAALRMDVKSIDCGLETFGPSTSLVQHRKSTTSVSSFPSVVAPSHTGDMSASGLPSAITSSVSGVPEPSEAPEPEPLPQARRPRPLKKLRPQSQEPSAIQLPEPAAQTGLSEISEDKQELASEVPRPRLLKRRVKTTTIAEALGLDNSNASITPMIPLEEEPKPQPLREEVKRLERVKPPSSATVQEGSDIVVSSTSRPNRLKRRADVLAERTTTAPTPIEINVPEAPALKRYRQLFEGVERAASSVFEVHGGSTISAAVPSQPVQPPEPADDTRKRKSADRDEEDDANMEDVTRAKRRVPASGISQKPDQLSQSAPSWEPNPGLQVTVQSQTLPASQAHTRASGSRGAAPGAPDKDNALLHALAQTENEAISTLKTGKPKGAKTAPIDQEFSNMRIVEEKEEEASRRRAEEMRVWEECERDVNVRGNFMVVELVNLVRRNRGPPVRSINPAWEGKPDFKKFKKKAVGPRVARVAVFASSGENLDYGMGDDYWEQKAALAGVRGSSEGPPTHIRVQDDDSDTPMPKIAKPMHDNKTTQATIYTKASAATEPRTKPKPQRIAISSYESEEDESNKLRGASSNIGIGRRRPVAGSARKTDLTDFRMHDEDEDSEGGGQPRRGGRQEEQSYGSTRVGDEDAVSHMVEEESHQITTAGALSHMSSLGGPSLGVRKTVTSGSSVVNPSKPKKVTVVDSDSDGGGFKGFGTKRRKRGVAQ
ncbi:titin [Rhizoctonia solani AG-1 IB]|uniref:Titin n=1 Tax=Thanatephorus cucumeris (strain AG1-IB / isolate 7/3/14) TaxID=1108050 RepID=A0A0B7FIH4_THACB|nr:titin [Rhizoctonia solani AG-1 IB]